MAEWRIVGYSRESGLRETVYEGDDYSNISDMMHDDGEPDERYHRMELYRNGKLDEVALCPEPHGIDWGGIVGMLIAIGFIIWAASVLMH